MALKENSRLVFDFVKKVDNGEVTDANGNVVKQVTANDIVNALGLTSRQVNGIITAAFQRHTIKVGDERVPQPLMKRVKVEITKPDGTSGEVNVIELTDEGRAFDPDAE